MLLRVVTMTALLIGFQSADATESRILKKEIVVNAPLTDVWKSWTTEQGLTFISRNSRVELDINGSYEWFLDPESKIDGQDSGSRGSRVLSFLPERMIAFAWTFPPDIPDLRAAGEITQVVVLFEQIDTGQVRVELHAHGWQEGDSWRRGWDYFDRAWDIVLDAMKVHLEK